MTATSAPPRDPIHGHAPSWYATDCAPIQERRALAGQARCDVCVVGGGFTGLSAALDLAARGYSVTVLEAERIGWGASGRNGGQIVPGYAGDMRKVIEAVGRDDARRIWDIGIEGVDLVRQRVTDHGIDCDLAQGYLHAAITKGQLAEFETLVAEMKRDFGETDLSLLDRTGLADMIATERYVGGVANPAGGHLQPLRYALGLAAAAEAAGATLFENSRVLSYAASGPACVVRTADGTVQSDFLVLAGNAYLGGLVREIRQQVMPVATYVIATEPLDPALAAKLLPTNAAVSDASFVLDYFRLSRDRRMLFGGGVSYSTLPPPNIAQAIRRRMVRVFPDLTGIRVDYAWGGNVGITPHRFPSFGRFGQKVLYAQGFSGQGVALTGIAGRLLAEAVAGQAERFDLMSRMPTPRFPGGRLLRLPMLLLATTYCRLRDLI